MNTRYRISRVIVPADSLALVSLDQAKAILGITDTSQDAALTQRIDEVSTAINGYCDRVFVRQSYRDQFRQVCQWSTPGDPLQTRQFPVPLDIDGPVLTVTQDGGLLDPSLYEVDIATGSIYRLDGVIAIAWTGTSIVADYDAGYDVIPSDVQGAALEWLTARWTSQGRDPALRSETIPDVISQTWATTDTTVTSLPSGVRDLLAPYRLWSA